MGNCGSTKTDEGPEPMPVSAPEPVTEGVKVDPASVVDANVETKIEEKETPNEDNKSLSTLLNTNVEEAKKTEEVKAEANEVKAEPKAEEVKAEPKAEEPKTEVEVKVQEEKPKTEVA